MLDSFLNIDTELTAKANNVYEAMCRSPGQTYSELRCQFFVYYNSNTKIHSVIAVSWAREKVLENQIIDGVEDKELFLRIIARHCVREFNGDQ